MAKNKQTVENSLTNEEEQTKIIKVEFPPAPKSEIEVAKLYAEKGEEHPGITDVKVWAGTVDVELPMEVTDEIVNSLVSPDTLEELALTTPKYKFAANGALRNLHAINDSKKPSIAPVLAKQTPHHEQKPASVKSMEGSRTGMFKIDKDRPIRN